ncbi:MAG TPA: thioredoxin domain-containing protein [Polyangia bacterium]|jgi:Protein-disulfide isomerase|nr:thioredoxin domain-containing protein [Polyangia bacterium]
MIFTSKASLARIGAMLLLSAAGALSYGCKSAGKDATVKSPAAAASPCPEFVNAICAKAGKESPACQSVTATAELLSPAACKAASKDSSYALQKLGDQRKVCDHLASRLCKEIGDTTETCKMVQTQTKTFPPDRCTTMIEHYADVLADLKRMESANKPLAAALQATLAKGDAPSFGPADSKVTMVEFSDFQCPYCSKAAQVTQKIKDKYSKQVRFVFRQFPLSFHDKAHGAAEAAMAANAQGKFWQMHDLMFANQGALERESLDKYAKQIGLNLATFKKAMDSKQYLAAVDADVKLGGEAAVSGTPSLFLNGARVQDPTNFDTISGMIEAELKK